MPDNIWGLRFVQRGTEPAWHHKGFLVGNQSLRAEQMLDMVGSFDVILMPNMVWVPTPNEDPSINGDRKMGKLYKTGSSQIVRMPTADDPSVKFFGSPVSSTYELIGPREAARIWDSVVPLPTETLGVLKHGQELFISAKLGTFDVKGDQVDQYLVYDNPMYSNNAAIVVSTCVRPVCQNTLTLGIHNATSKMVILHTPGAKQRVTDWISSFFVTAPTIFNQARDDMTLMASRSIRSLDATNLLSSIYPDPPFPKPEWHNLFGLTHEEHLERFDKKLSRIRGVRSTIMELFGGDGFGQDTLAAQGTVFGLYNAIAEYEDNRKGTAESRAIGSTVGDRATVVRRAYMRMIEFSRS